MTIEIQVWVGVFCLGVTAVGGILAGFVMGYNARDRKYK